MAGVRATDRVKTETAGPARYWVMLNGEYLGGIKSTGLETVKDEITWTNDKSKAATFTLEEVQRFHYKITAGYSGTKLKRCDS